MRYTLATTSEFEARYKKYIKADFKIQKKIDLAIFKLLENPFYPGLRTHKVNTKEFNEEYSSRITGDLRLIWRFSRITDEILILTIGGHSGKRKVYI